MKWVETFHRVRYRTAIFAGKNYCIRKRIKPRPLPTHRQTDKQTHAHTHTHTHKHNTHTHTHTHVHTQTYTHARTHTHTDIHTHTHTYTHTHTHHRHHHNHNRQQQPHEVERRGTYLVSRHHGVGDRGEQSDAAVQGVDEEVVGSVPVTFDRKLEFVVGSLRTESNVNFNRY